MIQREMQVECYVNFFFTTRPQVHVHLGPLVHVLCSLGAPSPPPSPPPLLLLLLLLLGAPTASDHRFANLFYFVYFILLCRCAYHTRQ